MDAWIHPTEKKTSCPKPKYIVWTKEARGRIFMTVIVVHFFIIKVKCIASIESTVNDKLKLMTTMITYAFCGSAVFSCARYSYALQRRAYFLYINWIQILVVITTSVTISLYKYYMTCYRDRCSLFHYDVIKWKHFPRHWPFVRGIRRSPVNSLHKGQWRGALMFSLICVRINSWANTIDAGDLRRHLVHYDVIIICWHSFYK